METLSSTLISPHCLTFVARWSTINLRECLLIRSNWPLKVCMALLRDILELNGGGDPAAERDRIVGSASNMGFKSTAQVIHHQGTIQGESLSSLSALSFILSSSSLFLFDFTSDYIHCICSIFLSQFWSLHFSLIDCWIWPLQDHWTNKYFTQISTYLSCNYSCFVSILCKS